MRVERLISRENYSRADVCLSENFENVSRSSAKKIIDEGFFLVNGKTVKSSQSVREGDEIKVSFPDPTPCEARPENIPLDIIYQDEDLAVINKPQGMTVHAGAGNTEGTLVNALLYNLDSLSTINGDIRPGIVHRIDKDTSGLLLVAKNDFCHVSLSKQIADKTCKRSYLALLDGNLKDDEGQVVSYIGRSQKDRKMMAEVSPDKGKLAVTYYKVLQRYERYCLCLFELKTGRTHQIRVHCKGLGHPIVGDKVYGAKKNEFGLSGQLLHAYKITFIHPRTGNVCEFLAPIPEYFERVLRKLREKI